MSSELRTDPHSKRARFQDVPLAPSDIIPAQREAGVSEWNAAVPGPREHAPSADLRMGLAILGMAVAIVAYLIVFLVLAIHVWR
jgi:hypothetical protein